MKKKFKAFFDTIEDDKRKYLWILFGVLIIGTFLRTYNVPFRYGLGEETVRDAVIGIEGARQIQFPLTGSFSSLGPFTFGPWYAYQLILFYYIFPHEYSPWIYLTLISIAYIFILYKIGEKIEGKTLGLILAFLAAVSPSQIISATHLTSHNNTHLFAALAILFFLIIILGKKISYWLGYGLGFVIGIGINLHFQMSGLLILPFILLFYKRKEFLYFVTSSLGLVTSFVPFLIFELNNHWFNTKNIVYYLLFGKNAIYVPNRWIFYLRDFWPYFWGDVLGVPNWFAGIIILLFIGVISLQIYKRKISVPFIFILVAFLFLFVLLRYYWGPRFFGYLNFLRPFIYLFTAYSFYHISRFKYGFLAVAILLFGIIYYSYPRTLETLRPDSLTMRVYTQVAKLEERYPNKKFSINTCSESYATNYNSFAFSVMFVLELKDKITKNGLPVGITKDCTYPGEQRTTGLKEKKQFDFVKETELIDFSKISHKELAKNGWTSIDFPYMYNSYARWWFKEQP